jgi:2-polyprenyl-3-methyl-5-hydroxy-6-metoxy-1,4-benzoquinol methylase
MNDRNQSVRPGYFESLYARDPDPWRFADSEYERKKYAATVGVLNGREIKSAFEVGCSIGILTSQLAHYCKSLLSVDVAEHALEQARRNCKSSSNVKFKRMEIPREWPEDKFDLIVLSEVLYYFCAPDIRKIAFKTVSRLAPGGLALLVHWTRETDYPCQGDPAVECFLAASGDALTPILTRREPEYRLDLLKTKQ